MNIFRIFFVSTVLIPVLVVVATSDDSGLRIRKPRNIVISEDGTRTSRRLHPVNSSDRNCPALGCTGNLTSDSYNGKGSLATTLLPNHTDEQEQRSSIRIRRFDSPDKVPTYDLHRPLKLEIKAIKNSTRLDNDYVVAPIEEDDIGIGRSIMNSAVLFSYGMFYGWKLLMGTILVYSLTYCWRWIRKTLGISDDYVETYVKLGKDDRHPFGKLGKGWNPIFGISLKSKPDKKGWGWGHHHPHHHHGWGDHHHHHHQHGWGQEWPPAHYGGAQGYGWPTKSAWNGGTEEETNLRFKFDKKKGWKLAKKFTKKYGKKAHKYGLRPSKYSYMFDTKGNLQLDNKGLNKHWRRR